MSFFDLDTTATRNLLDQARQNPLDPETLKPGWFAGMYKAPVTGIASAWNDAALLLGDAATPVARAAVRPIDKMFGSNIDDWLLREQQKAVDNVKGWAPDPRTTGVVSQAVHGIFNIVPEVVAGGPTVAATLQGYKGYRGGMAEGLDPGTALGKGAIDGVATWVGLKIPMTVAPGMGATANVLGAAAVNAPVGMVSRGATGEWLRARGYPEMADQYQVFDQAAIAMDLIMGGAFGALAHYGPRGAEAYDGWRKRFDGSLLPTDKDTALFINNVLHAELDTAPGIPADPAARAAHVEALTKALEDLLAGRPVTAPDGVTKANFVENPSAAATRDAVRATVEQHLGPEWATLQAELARRGLPTDPNLYQILPGDRPPVRFTDNVGSMLSEWEKTGDTATLLTRLRDLQGKLERRAENNAAARMADRERGPLWIRERLLRAERNGDITPEARGLVEWLLDKNPAIADDLAISIRESKGGVGSGNYNPAMRLVTLLKGRGNDETAAHEVLHHGERLMPEVVRDGVRQEWIKQLEAVNRWATENQVQPMMQAVDDALRAAAGDRNAYNRLAEQISKGEVPYSFYQFVNPSEFWAVNAARLVRERAAAGDKGWVAQAVQWLKEFIEKAKAAFGLRSDAPIIRGLEAVLMSDGQVSGRMIGDGLLAKLSDLDDRLRVQRTLDELIQAAESQKTWKNWYNRHEQVLVELFGTDAPLFQKLLSVTSQAASVKANVGLAVKAYRQLLAGEPFVGYLPAVIKNLERVRDEEAIQGQKIGEYSKANDGDQAGVAVDRHIAQLFFGVDRPTPAQVAVAKARIGEIADRLGWEPRQVQAALWAFNQVRQGADPSQVVSYDTVLLNKLAEIVAIRSEFGRDAPGGFRPGRTAFAGADAGQGATGRAGGARGRTAFDDGLDYVYNDVAPVAGAVADQGGKIEQVAPVDRLMQSDRIPTITLRDLIGKKIFPTVADRTRAGALFTGIDGAKLEAAVPLPGGPYFPLRTSSMGAGVVWADRGKSVVTKKEQKIGGGADYMMVLLGDANMHQSNRTVAKSFIAQLDAYVSEGRISPENLAALEELVRTSPTTDRAVQAHIDRFPGFSDPAAFHAYVESLSFEASKRLVTILDSAAAEKHGAPSMIRILDATREPSLAGGRWGDGVLVLKVNPDKPMIKLGEQGTLPHPDYPYGVQGEVVGKLEVPINYEILWKDWLDRAREQSIQRNAMSEAPKENFQPNTRRGFELALPELEITPELIARVGDLKQANVDSPRQAQLAIDMALDRWSTSDQKVKEGGASPQGFVDAVNHSAAKVVLNEYSTPDVVKAVKAGTMKLYNLGRESGIWFALKRGPADTYGLDIAGLTDNEVTLTAVVNNEQGARGIGGPAVLLKALQEGATVLDCFAVKSPRFPDGFLPALYREFGFEVVGEVPFAKEYYSAQKLADAERFWRESTPGWDPAKDGYPPVVIMKWKGSDADRAGILDRYLRSGAEGLLPGRDPAVAEADWADIGRNAETQAGAARPAADAGGAAGDQAARDRGSLASRARGVAEGVAKLNDSELRNLGIGAGDAASIRARLGIDQAITIEALNERPDLEIPTDDGAMVSAHDAFVGADAEIASAQRDSPGYEAAVACALRG